MSFSMEDGDLIWKEQEKNIKDKSQVKFHLMNMAGFQRSLFNSNYILRAILLY